MSHWLDDAARGLAEGTHSRRDVLRRGGAIAGGAMLVSVTGPLGTLRRAKATTVATAPCPDFACPTFDICCGGHTCCNPMTHFCCGESCIPRDRGVGCCHDRAYDPGVEKCCPESTPGAHGHACGKYEECCGATECCKEGEQCCNSGKLRYCAPKGKCCPKGQHRVTCGGTAKRICCPEGEYCCGGKCCKPADCHNGKCGGKCPPGQQMCFGKCGCPSDAKCCDKGDCVGATGQFVCCGVTTGSFVRAGNACCVGGKPGTLCGGVCCLQSCCGATGFEVCCEPGQGCCDANGACVACSDIRLKHHVHTLSGSRRRP